MKVTLVFKNKYLRNFIITRDFSNELHICNFINYMIKKGYQFDEIYK